MKKILFIHHSASWGGAPINLLRNIKALDRQKFEPIVLLLKNSIIAEKLAENGIPFTVAKSKFYRKYYQFLTHSEAGYIKWYQIGRFVKLCLFWLFSHYIFAIKELRNIECDIIQVNSSVLIDWLKPGKQINKKVILHIQEPFRKGKFDIIYFCARKQIKNNCDHIITISKDNARRINIPEKTTIVYNYADIPAIKSIQPSYSSKTFLYLGGASYIKGFYTLVNALDKINNDIVILFAGNYNLNISYKSWVLRVLYKVFSNYYLRKKAITKIENNKNARIIGLIDDVSSYFEQSVAIVSPFIKPHFSRPVIEAYLHSKPAIGSNVEGMAEIIIDGKTGILTQKGSSTELASAINYLANNPNEAVRLGNNGFNFAIKNFSPQNSTLYEKIYKSI
jgi:glycosyltransferase involved in cell wall biosynthesis